MTGMVVSVLDMCRYGMVASDELGEAPVRKTTKIATNVPEIADALSARCEGGHRHVHLISGRPRNAAIYPSGFCSALVKGFQVSQCRREVGGKWYGDVGLFREQAGAIGSLLNFERADLFDPSEDLGGRYIDDLKGTELDPELT